MPENVIVVGKETVVQRRGASWSFHLPRMHRAEIDQENGLVSLSTPQDGSTYYLGGIEETDAEVIVKLGGIVHVPNDPSSVVFGNGLLWVGESDTGKVVRVNSKTGTIEGKPITVGGALLTLAADGDKVWVANSYSGRLVTINAPTATVVANRPLAGVSGIAASRGTVWTTFSRKGELAAFDAASGRQTLAPLRIRGGADWVEAVGSYLWVTSAAGITRIAHG